MLFGGASPPCGAPCALRAAEGGGGFQERAPWIVRRRGAGPAWLGRRQGGAQPESSPGQLKGGPARQGRRTWNGVGPEARAHASARVAAPTFAARRSTWALAAAGSRKGTMTWRRQEDLCPVSSPWLSRGRWAPMGEAGCFEQATRLAADMHSLHTAAHEATMQGSRKRCAGLGLFASLACSTSWHRS